MNNSDRARLALRKYALMGFWHNRLVASIIMNTNYDYIMRYNLQSEEDVKQDVDLIKRLTSVYSGMYTDLWSDQELDDIHIHLTDIEFENKYNRLTTDEDRAVLESVFEKLEQVKNGEVISDSDGYAPIEILELLDLAKEKQQTAYLYK